MGELVWFIHNTLKRGRDSISVVAFFVLIVILQVSFIGLKLGFLAISNLYELVMQKSVASI